MNNKIDLEVLASVLEKAETGPVIDEKVWDQQLIGAKVKELIAKYDLTWDESIFVPSDDALADRLFAAGMELALESGVYCITTKRQMQWEEGELQSDQSGSDRCPDQEIAPDLWIADAAEQEPCP